MLSQTNGYRNGETDVSLDNEVQAATLPPIGTILRRQQRTPYVPQCTQYTYQQLSLSTDQQRTPDTDYTDQTRIPDTDQQLSPFTDLPSSSNPHLQRSPFVDLQCPNPYLQRSPFTSLHSPANPYLQGFLFTDLQCTSNPHVQRSPYSDVQSPNPHLQCSPFTSLQSPSSPYLQHSPFTDLQSPNTYLQRSPFTDIQSSSDTDQQRTPDTVQQRTPDTDQQRTPDTNQQRTPDNTSTEASALYPIDSSPTDSDNGQSSDDDQDRIDHNFRCEICTATFPQEIMLIDHKSSWHPDRLPTCWRCCLRFPNRYGISSHRVAVHCRERLFACMWCGDLFDMEIILKAHEKMEHNIDGNNNTECT